MKEKLNEFLLSRPFHQWLGLSVLDVGGDYVEIAAIWRPEWIVNPEGQYIHGGILAALVDLGADMSLYSRIGKGVPTIDLRVDYHAPARGDLRVVGKVVKFGKRFSSAQAEVFDRDGRLVASGRGVFHTGE